MQRNDKKCFCKTVNCLSCVISNYLLPPNVVGDGGRGGEFMHETKSRHNVKTEEDVSLPNTYRNRLGLTMSYDLCIESLVHADCSH